jgi:hypothetical protein
MLNFSLKLNFWVNGEQLKDPKHITSYVAEYISKDALNRRHTVTFDKHEVTIPLTETDFDTLMASSQLAVEVQEIAEITEKVNKKLSSFSNNLDKYLKRIENQK